MYQRTVQDERSRGAKRLRPNSASVPPQVSLALESSEPSSGRKVVDNQRKVVIPREGLTEGMNSERLKDQMRIQLQKPVKMWDVSEVSDWVSAIGLPQYRKRFIHQHISGHLLLRLNHANLKVPLPGWPLHSLTAAIVNSLFSDSRCTQTALAKENASVAFDTAYIRSSSKIWVSDCVSSYCSELLLTDRPHTSRIVDYSCHFRHSVSDQGTKFVGWFGDWGAWTQRYAGISNQKFAKAEVKVKLSPTCQATHQWGQSRIPGPQS